jgi:phosphoribosylformylglycinamidine cyclo-ligase
MASEYEKLGVDAHKKGIEVFKDTQGIYRHAFCSIHEDPMHPGFGYVHHSDGGGSKHVQNYLNWRVTGDINAFVGMMQDAAAMNFGDAFAVGDPEWVSFVDYIAINRFHAPKTEILAIVADEMRYITDMLRSYDINFNFSGGETADLPDQLRTIDISGTVFAYLDLKNAITGENIAPGDAIIGIPSNGMTVYERKPPGAIMSNGLTLARHVLMHPRYAEQFPEISEPGKPYTGRFGPVDRMPGTPWKTVGEELTAPTRIYAPIFKRVCSRFGDAIHGIVFNTGGGATKCLRIGKSIKYVKDNMPRPPGIFELIQSEGQVPWREMHEDFNLGVGAEMYVDGGAGDEVVGFIEETFRLDCDFIGQCEKADRNAVHIVRPYGEFVWQKE